MNIRVRQNKILFVEEAINRQKFILMKQIRIQDLDEAIKRQSGRQTAVEYVLGRLAGCGFRTKNGDADWVGFYKYARIDPSVWSTFISNTHNPSKQTLLKMIIGLRLSILEAQEFLMLAGSGFRADDLRDQVILACLDCGYYEIEDVYEILEFYSAPSKGEKPKFQNIYG